MDKLVLAGMAVLADMLSVQTFNTQLFPFLPFPRKNTVLFWVFFAAKSASALILLLCRFEVKKKKGMLIRGLSLWICM